MSLFRIEAIEHQSKRDFGRVLIANPLKSWVGPCCAFSVVLIIVATLYFGHYTKKIRVSGQISTDSGVLRISMPAAGRVSEISVREGTVVVRGQPLFAVDNEKFVEKGPTQSLVMESIDARRRLLITQIESQKDIYTATISGFQHKLENLSDQKLRLMRQLELQRGRLALARSIAADYRRLQEEGFSSTNLTNTKENDVLDQQSRIEDAERQIAANALDIAATMSELRSAPAQNNLLRSDLQRQLVALEADSAVAESGHRLIVSAPLPGSIATMMIHNGQHLPEGAAALQIEPTGSATTATLYVDSTSIGSVEVGQKILVRYASYPYQKYGQYAAIITSISRLPLSREELALLRAARLPKGPSELAYRVTARLKQPYVGLASDRHVLLEGMELEADIMIESRRLADWLLAPLKSAIGRLSI